MRLGGGAGLRHTERIGLTVVMTSLIVILVTAALWFTNRQALDETHLHAQGERLVKILSQLEFRQIVPAANEQRLSNALQFATRETNLAYLSVVDKAGEKLQEFAAPGIVAPSDLVPTQASEWFGKRKLILSAPNKEVWEFYAPLLNKDQFAGHIRLGYFAPMWGPDVAQLPLVAAAALAIFLLSPLFYFLLRREVRPLAKINQALGGLSTSAPTALENAGSGQWGEFVSQFNGFVTNVQERMSQLESDRNDLETSAKVTAYQRTRIRSILESLPDGIVVLDQSGCVSLVNSRLAQTLGIDASDISGKRPSEWLADQNVVAYLSKYDRSQGVGTSNTVPMEFVPRAFPNRLLSVTSCPVQSVEDKIILTETLVMFRDVTAEKLVRDSSSEFIAHVAHELKSPLSVLSMYAESLQGDDGDDEGFRIDATNVIRDEVERLSLLITNILSVSKLEMGSISIERKRVKLKELATDAFNTCMRSANDKNLTLDLDLPNEISPVAMDKELMRIAINNLLTNAIKYSDSDGSIKMSIVENDSTVQIRVRDHGIGIGEEDQQKVFDKFYRSEDENALARSGHGLGLSLAREIVQLHHGTLSLESKLGEGSEFTITMNKETDLLKQAV